MSKLSRVFATIRVLPVILAASFALPSIRAQAADEEVDRADAPYQQVDPSSGQDTPSSPLASAPWPIEITDKGRTFLIYQPQVDKWENSLLEGRSAVSVRTEASGQQNFGVIYFSARTQSDQANRTVTVRDAVVSKADFPAASTATEDYLSVLRPQLAAHSWQIARDRLQSDMEIDRVAQQGAQQPLKNDPPRIIYSDRPAVLVPIDGNPVLRPVADTGLMRVTNTRALLLQDKGTARYFLYVADRWMEAARLDGPWSVSANPSAQLEQARQLATQQDQVDLLQGDAGNAGGVPDTVAVFISTTPTELLQTDGPAQYAPIEQTQLLYVTNTPNKLFLDLRTQNHYALISGRWYRTPSLAQGQWSYVAATGLPADFAMIPAQHPTESVRAAVPGTPQAREAVIANTVPQMATVTRAAAHLEVAYDGSPVFQPIEGTPLQNAVNSPVPVIRVDEASFYALDNGVWFVASSPFGPWTVTSYVPAVIYSIPRTSPLYYVTYVRVYDATPEVVYVGYTPGYVGSYVSSDNVVVYGTGWPYRPWIGSVWYGAPVTWGFGFSFCYSWWHPYPWYWHHAAWRPYHYVPYYRPGWGPWRGPIAHPRASIIAGGGNAHRATGPGWHGVDRIYDRWDRRSVAWNAPHSNSNRSFANRRQPEQMGVPHPRQDNAARPDGRGRWTGDNRRDRSAPQFRSDAVNAPAARAPHDLHTAPPVQAPWRGAPAARQDDRGRVQSAPQRVDPRAVGNERRSMDNRPSSPAYRPRENVQQDRQATAPQWRQHMPPVAGVPVERAPAQAQRAQPQQRSFYPPPGRVERPAMANPNPGRIERPAGNPGRIERPASINSGRSLERPQMNSGRMPQNSIARPQSRGIEGRSHGNSGGGGGQWNGGGGHR